jgi:hypothetical protein
MPTRVWCQEVYRISTRITCPALKRETGGRGAVGPFRAAACIVGENPCTEGRVFSNPRETSPEKPRRSSLQFPLDWHCRCLLDSSRPMPVLVVVSTSVEAISSSGNVLRQAFRLSPQQRPGFDKRDGRCCQARASIAAPRTQQPSWIDLATPEAGACGPSLSPRQDWGPRCLFLAPPAPPPSPTRTTNHHHPLHTDHFHHSGKDSHHRLSRTPPILHIVQPQIW